jgi:hypothetical protein
MQPPERIAEALSDSERLMSYAAGTTVSPEKSQLEIVQTLKRYGATGFMYGESEGRGVVVFVAEGRRVRFVVPLVIERKEFYRDGNGRVRSEARVTDMIESEHRRRWRALALAIKAKLEVVKTGISTFEEEFLAHIVLPDGSTVGEFVSPQLEAAYTNGVMPMLLPGWRPELES